MGEINDNDIKVGRLNKSDLENEVSKESDKTQKCEDNIIVEKNVVNVEIKEDIEKQSEDSEVYNNNEVQCEDEKEKPTLNVQEESDKSEEKVCSDEKEEAAIDNEVLKNDDETQVEGTEEIKCKDNIEDENIMNEQLKNDIKNQNVDAEVYNNQEVQLEDKNEQVILNAQEESTKIEEKGYLDKKEEVASDNEMYKEKNEDPKIEVVMDDIKEKLNEEELNLKNDLNEYKYQIDLDVIAYERNLSNYRQWASDGKELILRYGKTFEKIEAIVEKFNKEISTKLEQLSDEDKKLVENRIKGINMINKMSKNAIHNGVNKLLEKTNQDFDDTSIINDISNKGEDEIRNILNENYSSITHIESKKSNLVDSYFKFIEGSLLPILDGIESGISFVKNSNKEIIQKEILPVYIELNRYFDELLLSINVKKIDIELKTKIDFSYVEVLDIEDTEEENLDETIESVIRNGYEYLKDVYGIGHNHIIRQAQIVAYKYNK